MKLPTMALVAVSAVILGGLAGRCTAPTPEPTYRTVEVPVGAMLNLEPKIETGWLKKAWYDALEVQQRAVARGGAVREVGEFCGPWASAPSVVDSTGAIVVPSEPIEIPVEDQRAVLLSYRVTEPWWPWAPSKVEVFGALNTGDRFHDTSEGHGTIEGGVKGAESWAEGERLGMLKPTAHVAGGVVVGIGIGLIIAATQ